MPAPIAPALTAPGLSHGAYIDSDYAPRPAAWRGRWPNALVTSLAIAFITTCISGASVVYAVTHIPEVDPDAEAAPVAAVAELTDAAPATPDKLEVLTPPVYGAGVVNEAPAMPFMPLNAQSLNAQPLNAHATMDQVDLDRLAQADGVARPCADPCSAQAGYVAADAADEADADDTNDNNGGNAPPPPGMVIN